jgi:DNA-binding transcriptional LysR family regulator
MAHISRFDLNLLVVFDAIYREASVTRAAEKLNLTQPAISHALGRLRLLLEDPLFERQGRSLVPTAVARGLVDPVRQALRTLDVALTQVGQFDPGMTERRFVIGTRDILESTVLPALMQRICAVAPLVDVSSVRADRRSLESGLAAGAIDVAMDILLPLSEDIRRRRVEFDRLIVVARRNHPEIAPGLDLATYLRLGHILVSSRRQGGGIEDLELAQLGLQRRVRLRCQHYFAACRVASQTDLIVTMPERYASIISGSGIDTQILPMPIEARPLELYLYWHSSAEEDPANRWLRSQLLETLI